MLGDRPTVNTSIILYFSLNIISMFELTNVELWFYV